MKSKKLFTLLFIFLQSCSYTVENSQTGEDPADSEYQYNRISNDPMTFYFDSEQGNNDSSGTSEEKPLKNLWTIQFINFIPGDRILLKRGSLWIDDYIYIKSSGIPDEKIVISSYGEGNQPQIKCSIYDVKNGSLLAFPAIYLEGSYIQVEDINILEARIAPGIQFSSSSEGNIINNCEIANSGIGVLARGKNHTIRDNIIHDLHLIRDTPGGDDDYGANGIFIEGSDISVLHNTFRNCKSHSFDYETDGGSIELWKTCRNIEIAYNWSEENNGFMELGGEPSDSISNITVHHNVILNDIVIFLPHISGSFTTQIELIRYENNTIVTTVETSDYALFFCPENPLNEGILTLNNNIFYTTTPNSVFSFHRDSEINHSYNIFLQSSNVLVKENSSFTFSESSTEQYNTDPLFLNSTEKDYRLQSNSPAIDAGTALGYTKDYLDNIISSPDIGAFEYTTY